MSTVDCVIAIVEVGVDRHELICGNPKMPGYPESYAEWLPDERHEDAEFDLGFGLALSSLKIIDLFQILGHVFGEDIVSVNQ